MIEQKVTAWYVGDGTPRPFEIGQVYPVTIKTKWFSRKVTVYRRCVDHDKIIADSLHQFANRKLFNNCWQIIKEYK